MLEGATESGLKEKFSRLSESQKAEISGMVEAFTYVQKEELNGVSIADSLEKKEVKLWRLV